MLGTHVVLLLRFVAGKVAGVMFGILGGSNLAASWCWSSANSLLLVVLLWWL